jgi:hypothetical protein
MGRLTTWKRCGNTMFWQNIDQKPLVYDNLMFLNPMTLTKVFTAGSSYTERPDIAEPFQDGYMTVMSERLPFLYESVARAGARLVVGPSPKLQEEIVQEAVSWAAYRDVYREEHVLTDGEIARIFLEKWDHKEKSKVLAGIEAAFYGHSSLPLIIQAQQEMELQESEAWKQEKDFPGVIVDIADVVLIRKGSAAARMMD